MADLGKLSDLLDANKAAELAQKNRKGSNTQPPVSTGAHLQLPLEAIEEDPDQPRQTFDEAFIDELAADLRSGIQIKSPISVRPQGEDGRYRINHGANRYRACIRAGKETIPAFIDDDHNPYDQIMENLKRRDLSPMDMGHWIQARIDNHGEKPADIAKSLGKHKSYVTQHQAIIDSPGFVKAVYASKATDSDRALYSLTCAALIDAAKTEEFCLRAIEVGGVTVKQANAFRKLLEDIANKTMKASGQAATAAVEPTPPASNPINDKTVAPMPAATVPTHVPISIEKKKDDTMQSVTTETIKRPCVTLQVGELTGQLQIHRAATEGYVWVRFNDGTEDMTPVKNVTLISITEQSWSTR